MSSRYYRPTRQALGLVSLAALAMLVATLVACGGGNDQATAAATNFVQQLPAEASVGAPVQTLDFRRVTADSLLDWAEYQYPQLFEKGPVSVEVDREGTSYIVRTYSHPGGVRYLAVSAGSNGSVYGLGDYTHDVLQYLGRFSDYTSRVINDECRVYPTRCGLPAPGEVR